MKVIVLDLDGTLLDSNKNIPHKTKDLLIDFQKEGGIIVLASGRPTNGMVRYAKELSMHLYNGYIISYNGAHLYSTNRDKTIWEDVIKKQDAKAILNHIEQFDVIPMIDDDEYMYVRDVYNGYINYENKLINIIEYESRGGMFKLCEKPNLSEFLDFNLYKILLAGDPNYLQTHHEKIVFPFKDKFNAMFTAPFYYEFTSKNSDKGLALKKLLEFEGIKLKDVIGFGDDLNDLPFLNIVGHPVIMKNGNPILLDQFKNICLSNDEEGIFNYLNEKDLLNIISKK